MIIPVLTTMFTHLARNHFGTDVLREFLFIVPFMSKKVTGEQPNEWTRDGEAKMREVYASKQEKAQQWTRKNVFRVEQTPSSPVTKKEYLLGIPNVRPCLDDIQAAGYKILDSLYMVTGLASTAAQRKSIGYETDKHRPGLGQCLSAFASCFPVAFLEPEYNKNNKYSVLAKTQDQSVQVQEMLQNLSTHIPHIEKLLTAIEQVSSNGIMYSEQPNVYDVDLPLMCSYLGYWFNLGPDGRKAEKTEEKEHRQSLPMTSVGAEHINRVFCALLRMLRNHIGVENAPWLCRTNCG
ncbi:hypothetical protein COOONC_11285 [Cooperia oncophora]